MQAPGVILVLLFYVIDFTVQTFFMDTTFLQLPFTTFFDLEDHLHW